MSKFSDMLYVGLSEQPDIDDANVIEDFPISNFLSYCSSRSGELTMESVVSLAEAIGITAVYTRFSPD